MVWNMYQQRFLVLWVQRLCKKMKNVPIQISQLEKSLTQNSIAMLLPLQEGISVECEPPAFQKEQDMNL